MSPVSRFRVYAFNNKSMTIVPVGDADTRKTANEMRRSTAMQGLIPHLYDHGQPVKLSWHGSSKGGAKRAGDKMKRPNRAPTRWERRAARRAVMKKAKIVSKKKA